MHSSKGILGSSGNELSGKRICLGVTGSVAASRSADLARELMRRGAEVFCVMSRDAQKLVGPALLHWATGNPVVAELTGECEHITFCGETDEKADLLLIAPCTANTLGKIAWGIDDTTVTTFATTALGAKIPIVIAPAMHLSMYSQPLVAGNIRTLKKIGVEFAGPHISEGKAKVAENSEIVDFCIRRLSKKTLAGKKIVVTAGATREFLDDVRFISNPSSGKMGIAVAREAWIRGADVALVAGHCSSPIPPYLKVVRAESAEEMLSAVKKAVKGAHAVVLASATGDFTVKRADGKISSAKKVSLLLSPVRKISDSMKKWNPKVELVVFKAESNVSDAVLAKSALAKMKACNADLAVANDVSKKGAGFSADSNRVLILDKSGRMERAQGRKSEIAWLIFELAQIPR